jgi:hypothetical protein
MGLASFLPALFAGGRVRVSVGDPLSGDAVEQVHRQLLAFERDRRDEFPGTPPEFLLEAAQYGAEVLYAACQLLVFREVEAEMIRQVLGRAWPGPLSPSAHYSVDLTLQYLPDVVRLAHGTSAEDPLVTELIKLAGRWPLSAVGIVGVAEGDVRAIVIDACLLRVYVDRIIARRDFHRLANERVRDVAWQAIGAFPELAPEVARGLGVSDVVVG